MNNGSLSKLIPGEFDDGRTVVDGKSAPAAPGEEGTGIGSDPGTTHSGVGVQPLPMILRGAAVQEYWFEEGCYMTEWLNSPDDPALSIARARVTPGVTTRLHRLVGVAERYVILQGQGRVELVGPDGELTSADHYVSDVEPGDVVVIPSLVSQRITNIGDSDLIFLALCTPRFSRAAYEDSES